MPDLSTFASFVAAALVLLVTPGPAVLYVGLTTALSGSKSGR